MSRARVVILALLVLLMLLAGSAARAETAAMQRTAQLIETFKQVVTAPSGKKLSPTQEQTSRAAFKSLDRFFDFDRLTMDTITGQRERFSAEQIHRFREDFAQLIRLVAFPGAGDFFRKASHQLSPVPTKGAEEAVEVLASLPAEDLETRITFHWAVPAAGGSLQVVDVSFDGSSVVKDYQNQFGRMIGKTGVSELLAKMSERLAQEQKKQEALLR